MKTIPTNIQTKLNSGEATLCYCWRVVKRDNNLTSGYDTLGFTDHDENVIIDGITYEASNGFEATVLDTDLGYKSSDITAIGVISSEKITESDVMAGLYDDAEVTLLWVDWTNPTDYITMLVGYIGEIKITGGKIEVEVKSLLDKLNRNIGRVYRRTCDAIFCDSRCGLTAATYTESGIISQMLADDVFAVTDLSSESGTYSYGRLIFTSGANIGNSFDVRNSTYDSPTTYIELWAPVAVSSSIGDTFDVIAGCKKTIKSCKEYGNILNFRGFPQIPGNKALVQTPVRGSVDNTGGSLIDYS